MTNKQRGKKEKKEKQKKQESEGISLSSDVQPELVAATNDSSIKSKRSMVRLGYFNDPFGRAFVSHPSRRAPLINRGYYIRAAAVSLVIQEFLDKTQIRDGPTPIQIISVGAGFDTTFFRLESQGKLKPEDKFFEIDFPPVMQRKVDIVKKTPQLNNLAPYLVNIHQPEVISKTQAKKNQRNKVEIIDQSEDIKFSTGKLIPVGCDLADIDNLDKFLSLAGVDKSKPTLILSECVLTYMFPETSSKVISWGSKFSNATFLMYEQSYPNDGFGEIMTKHFKKIGSPLRSINQFPSISLYESRFLSLGWTNVQIHDMNEVFYNVIDQSERERIAALEPFDESEEWHLKCSHYFILLAQTTTANQFHNYLSPSEKTTCFTSDFITKQLALPETQTAHSLLTHLEFPTIDRSKITSLQRWSHTSGETSSHIVVFGGFGGTKHSRLNDVHLIDKKTWEITTPSIVGVPPTARICATLTYWEGEKLILFGGRTSLSKSFNDIYQINTQNLTWERIETNSTPPAARWRHATALCHSKLFVFGGRDQSNVFSCTPFVFDLSTAEWKLLEVSGETPTPRHSHSCTALGNNQFLIIGGLNSQGIPLQDVWLFHYCPESSTHRFEEISVQSKCIARYSHSAVKLNEEEILIIGGVSSYLISPTDQFVLFNMNSRTWRPMSANIPKLPKGTLLNKQTAHLFEDQLVLIGGGGNCFSFGSHFNNFLSVFSSVPGKVQKVTNTETPRRVHLVRPRDMRTTNDLSVPVLKEMNKEKFLDWMENIRRPFIVRGDGFGKACELWKSSDYLKQQCGEKLVSIHQCETRFFDFVTKNYSFIVKPFSELVEKTLEQPTTDTTRYYLRSLGDNARRDVSDIWQSFPELLKDFSLPDWFPFEFPEDERYFSSVFRIGSRDMQLWTHFDMMDNVLCHISGTKHVTLWDPCLAHRMHLQGSTSEVIRIDEEDYEKYPDFPYSECVRVTLEPGDLLYIPSLWFHNIHAEDPCISVNIFWKHLQNEFYERKDLFGNRDLPIAVESMQSIEEASQKLSSLPPYYRDFYARLAIASLSKHLTAPL